MTELFGYKWNYESISTHILTRRMTEEHVDNLTEANISTHILTRRMTRRSRGRMILLCISTHILTRRMTLLVHSVLDIEYYFNSHPHEEDDGNKVMTTTGDKIFQLTSSRGG